MVAAWAVYKATLQDACGLEWMLEQQTVELTNRLQVISFGYAAAK